MIWVCLGWTILFYLVDSDSLRLQHKSSWSWSPSLRMSCFDMYAQTFMKDYKGEWSLGCKLGWPLLNVFCSTGSCHCHLFFLFGWYCLNFRSPHLDPKQPTPFCLCKEDSPYWWGAILHHNALAHVWCQKGKWSWLPAQSPCTTTERRLAVTTII